MPDRYKDKIDAIEKAKAIFEAAKASGNRFPLIPTAQAILESAWFKKESGKNNYFGQKATTKQAGRDVMTKEEIGGQLKSMKQRFRDYETLEESIQDHLKKWQPIYNDSDTLNKALGKLAPKYATDSKYADKVKAVIQSLQKRGIGTEYEYNFDEPEEEAPQEVFGKDQYGQIVNVNPKKANLYSIEQSPVVEKEFETQQEEKFYSKETEDIKKKLEFKDKVVKGELPIAIPIPEQEEAAGGYDLSIPEQNEFLSYFLKPQMQRGGQVEPIGRKKPSNELLNWWYNNEEVQQSYQMANKYDEGWIKKWLNDPETIERLKNDFGDNYKNILSEANSKINQLPVYSADKIKNLSLSDLKYNQKLQGFPNPEAFGEEEHTRLSIRPNMKGRYEENLHAASVKGENYPTGAHEITHGTGQLEDKYNKKILEDFPAKPFNFIDSYLSDSYKKSGNKYITKEGDTLSQEEILNRYEKANPGVIKDYLLYHQYLKEDGVYPQIMQLRRDLGVKPGEKINKETLKNVKDKMIIDKLKMLYDDDNIINIMNTVADNSSLDDKFYGQSGGEIKNENKKKVVVFAEANTFKDSKYDIEEKELPENLKSLAKKYNDSIRKEDEALEDFGGEEYKKLKYEVEYIENQLNIINERKERGYTDDSQFEFDQDRELARNLNDEIDKRKRNIHKIVKEYINTDDYKTLVKKTKQAYNEFYNEGINPIIEKRDSTFLEEANNVKKFYSRVDPNVNVEVVPFFKNIDTVKEKIKELGEEDDILLFGHSGDSFGGVDNKEISEVFSKAKSKNCYLGSCSFEDNLETFNSMKGKEIHYRPDTPWLGFNPQADTFDEGMWGRALNDEKTDAIIRPVVEGSSFKVRKFKRGGIKKLENKY